MPLQPTQQNINGTEENTNVFSPPNTCSSYKVGTWFFLFLCFRKAVKRLPDAPKASSFPTTWKQPGCFWHRCVVDRNVNPRERDGKQSGGRSAVIELL